MSTPEKPRPSLDDTLRNIDTVLAESDPSCLRCARQALLGEPHCAAHKRIPREMIEDLGPDVPVVKPLLPPVVGDYLSSIPLAVRPLPCRCVVTPVEPVVRDGDTVTLTQPGVYQFGGTVHPYGKPRPAEPHLVGAPGPTCPGCAADAERPGWLARTLHRLFT